MERLVELRLELFVEDVQRSTDFYLRVFGFQVGAHGSDDYTMLVKGHAVIAFNRLDALDHDHPLRNRVDEKLGRGVEIVLSVDDVEAAFEVAQKECLAISDLAIRPWGLRDFRVIDPDGYYIRVSGR